jgi:glycosyltransferase involved in cell wall biosynthesis
VRSAVPLVTIALPIYNGAVFMRRTIESVLNQDFADFELIIHDNASTDETPAIASEYAAGDPRVRYVRRQETVDVCQNFLGALSLARGEFFSWVAHDDYYDDRNHLGRLVEALRQGKSLAFPNVNLAHYGDDGRIERITRDHFGSFRGVTGRLGMLKVVSRFPSQQFYGLYRIEVLRRYVYMWEQCAGLRCFNEGRFVHKFLADEPCAFVDGAALNVGVHARNTGQTTSPGRLLRDYARFSFGLLADYHRNASLTMVEKLAIYTWIARVHLPYGLRMVGSLLKRGLMPGEISRRNGT